MSADADAYVAAAPEAFRPLLARLRATLAAALPEAQEVIEYGMPGFRIGGKIIAGYAAAAGLKPTKTGVTFSDRKPIPDALVERLALASRRAKRGVRQDRPGPS